MRNSRSIAAAAFVSTLLNAAAHAQTAQRQEALDRELRFTVASLKPFAPLRQAAAPPGEEIVSERVEVTPAGESANPGVVNAGRIHRVATLKEFLAEAFDVKEFQIVGPAWIDSDRFMLDATMPSDTTSQQMLAMMRNLLAERFQLTSHRETKDLPTYGLVLAKGGPKLKESSEAESAAVTNVQTVSTPGRAQITARNATMQDLATHLTRRLERPVADETGLTGRYDFVLSFEEGLIVAPPPPADAGPISVLHVALQAQLGLKLEARKMPAQVIVVDHIERTPAEN